MDDPGESFDAEKGTEFPKTISLIMKFQLNTPSLQYSMYAVAAVLISPKL
jgi:hypothetical protein